MNKPTDPTAPPRAHGTPPLQARLRDRPEDFVVEEVLDFAPDGEGEHAFLRVRKRGANTEWVARELARFAGCKPMDVGYAGLKDRDAVTTQAFTLHLPGRADPDWSAFPHAEVQVLEAHRSRRKLRRGAIKANRFVLRLTGVSGDRELAGQRLAAIAARGVPNYFGEQRFGRDGRNREQALAMFAGRRVPRATRSILLSAARSTLFNAVLAERVRRDAWDRPLDGEVWSLQGSRSWFGPQDADAVLLARLAEGDVHPSGPLWGRGDLPTQGDARALEEAVLSGECEIREGLEKAGLEQDRRALRLLPQQMAWSWEGDEALELRFALPSGAYATTVLRELAGALDS